jgi:hypothetical protein
MMIPRTTGAETMAGDGGGIDQAVVVLTTTRMMTMIIITTDVTEGTVGKDSMAALRLQRNT